MKTFQTNNFFFFIFFLHFFSSFFFFLFISLQASFNISDDIQDVLDEDSEHVLRRVFYQVDTNQSNSIEKKELLQFMQRGATPLHQACERFPRLKPLLKPSTYAAVLGRMDTSNTGRVTFEEFRTFAVSLSRQSSRADSRSYNGNNTNGANGQGTLQFDDEDNSVTNSNDNYRNDFSNEYDAEMSAIQGKRVMIIGVLGRLVNLRNSDVNGKLSNNPKKIIIKSKATVSHL